MKRKYSRAGLRLLFALLWSFPVFGQATSLQPGRIVVREIPAVDAPKLFNGADGFILEVADDIVEVELRLSTAPPESNLALHARFGQDVMRASNGSLVLDYTSNDPGGTERILINENSVPPLQPGRYYVAIEAGSRNPQTFAFLETSVKQRSGSANLETISSTNFETFSAEGWTRNYPGPEPFIDGSTLGDQTSVLQAVRLPDRSRALQIVTQGNDFFVAPPEYLGNLSLLGTQMRLEFDVKYESVNPAQTEVEVRLLGPGGAYRWIGPKPNDLFQHIVVIVEPSLWLRLGGTGTFAQTLANVQRIEIRADYGEADAKTTIDNVVMLGKAEAPILPAKTEFSSDAGGWIPNVPDAPYLQPRINGATQGDYRTSRNGIRWLGTDGNPGGHLRVEDFEDVNRDSLIAPSNYLGNWAALGQQARIEFDRRHTSNGAASRGVEMRIVGFGAAYAWVGPVPTRNWTHYTAPLQPENWALVAGEGTFAEVLRAVQRVEVTMDEVAGPEISGIDNFQIVVPAAVDPQLSADPQSLVFNTTQGTGTPTPKIVSLSSNSVQLQWFAAASSDAPWIQLSRPDGLTPGEVAVTASPNGLSVGVHRGYVEFAWLGSTSTVRVPVSLNIVSATGPLISQGGVVNAANYKANNQPGGELTGGMFIAVFGQRLADRTELAAAIPLPSSLGGASLSIGGIPAPMVFASDKQLVAVVPQSLTQQPGTAQNVTEADVVIVRGQETSPAERVVLAPVRPVLFSQDQSGTGPGAIQNVLGGGQVQLNTFDDPARPLETITVYGTGFGATQTAVPDGSAATSANSLKGSVRLTAGGVDAQVLYGGLSGLPHLYQINATLAADTPLGCEVPVKVIVDGVESNVVTAAVTRNGEACQ
jgi:uncharacterized protein (TIGR03437 family)